MTSRVKKLFHRKDHDSDEPTQRTRRPANGSSEPAIRTSLYDSTTAAGLPQTGDYPIKGDDSSVILQAGRKSSVRSRRSSSRGSQYDTSRRAARMSSPPPNAYGSGSYDTHDPYQDTSSPMQGQDDRQKGLSRSALPQEFAGLNLGERQGPTTVTSTVTTTHFGQRGPNTTVRYTPEDRNTGQYDKIGYGPPSRNIEPQSPYANRGSPQTQSNNSKMDSVGYGARQDTNPPGSYAQSNKPQSQSYPKRNKAPETDFSDSVPQSMNTNDDRRTPHGPRLTNKSSNSGFGPANLESQPSAQRLNNKSSNSRFGPANLESQSSRVYPEKRATHVQGLGSQPDMNPRSANRGEYQQTPVANTHRSEALGNNLSTGPNVLDEQDGYQDVGRRKSIPRKQVGNSGPVSYTSGQSSTPSSPQVGHSRQQSGPRPLPQAPTSYDKYGNPSNGSTTQSSNVLDPSRPITKGYAAPRDGHEVVNRAKNNTYDTEVVEKVAPAVVHENITKDVHHIREEVITKEVHTHDVFHRILPIIDVEVLPPRHFLPVEGGGLVEVSAAEVPGRGQNWVIAETASKIPSGQPAPQGRRGFTARNFPGQEGDTMRHITPNGHEQTDETWVHPPELEQGGKLTGQTWPMIFDDDNAGRTSHADMTEHMNVKSSKKGLSSQVQPAQTARRTGTMV